MLSAWLFDSCNINKILNARKLSCLILTAWFTAALSACGTDQNAEQTLHQTQLPYSALGLADQTAAANLSLPLNVSVAQLCAADTAVKNVATLSECLLANKVQPPAELNTDARYAACFSSERPGLCVARLFGYVIAPQTAAEASLCEADAGNLETVLACLQQGNMKPFGFVVSNLTTCKERHGKVDLLRCFTEAGYVPAQEPSAQNLESCVAKPTYADFKSCLENKNAFSAEPFFAKGLEECFSKAGVSNLSEAQKAQALKLCLQRSGFLSGYLVEPNLLTTCAAQPGAEFSCLIGSGVARSALPSVVTQKFINICKGTGQSLEKCLKGQIK